MVILDLAVYNIETDERKSGFADFYNVSFFIIME